jgi:hypothetical protein
MEPWLTDALKIRSVFCFGCLQLPLPAGCSVVEADRNKIICAITRTREVADDPADTPAAAAAPAKAAASADKTKAPEAEKGKASGASKAAGKSK